MSSEVATRIFQKNKSDQQDQIDTRVLRETPTTNGAELEVESVIRSTKARATGKVVLVKEGVEWKLDMESWEPRE